MGKVLRRVEPVEKREVADPLAQFAAAGMIRQGLSGLGFANVPGGGVPTSMLRGNPLSVVQSLTRLFQRRGLARDKAVAAALRLVYAQNLAGKKL